MRVLLAVAILVVALAGCGAEEPRSAALGAAATKQALAGAPEPLAALHRQQGRLLAGGASAFKRRLAELHGYPVVVNKWASWCGPCRSEFPHFQSQALKRGKTVAFLGVDSADNGGDAIAFLRKFPVSYPSYSDPDLKVAAVFKGVGAFPTTVFYDAAGKLVHMKLGAYPTEAALAADIERYTAHW